MTDSEFYHLLSDIRRGYYPALTGERLTPEQAELVNQEIVKIKSKLDDYYSTIVLSRVCL